jgi:gliding motility-associated-like protein
MHLYIRYGSFSIVINVNSNTVVAQAQSTSPIGCKPYTATFQNNSVNATQYSWNFGDPTSGASNLSTLSNPSHLYLNSGIFQVTLVAIDSLTCNKTDTIQFSVAVDTNRVQASFTANPITGCTPLSVTMNNTSWHALNYVWSYGDGSPDSTVINTSHLYNDTLSYWVTLIASDTSTCNLTDTARVLIDPYFTYVLAKFSVVDTQSCKQLSLAINNQSTGALTYNWDLGNGQVSNLFIPTYTYTTTGNYLIRLIADNPTYCKTTDTAYQAVHVYQKPSAAFTASPFIWKPDSMFSFINHSADADLYDWYVDGVLISNTSDYFHAFHKLGYHTICLVAKTTAGCLDSICDKVYVDVKPSIGVPNAFSPDGDGTNDVLYVYGLGIEELNFKIFNRWGQLIFETNDRNKGWDGTYKGVPQEMEVYVYVVSATFLTGSSKSIKGNVTLVR